MNKLKNWRGLALWVVVAATCASACGSRVPEGTAAGQRNTLNANASESAGEDFGAASPEGTAAKDASNVVTSGGSAGSANGSTVAAGARPGAAVAPVLKANEPVEVGVIYGANLCEAAAVLSGGAAPGSGSCPSNQDLERYHLALLAHATKTYGGLAGHPIKPVFFGFDIGGDYAEEQQRACTLFTQDHKVSYVVNGFDLEELRVCFNKAGIVNVIAAGSVSRADTVVYAENPRYVQSGALHLDKIAKALVNGLKARGYFTPGAKIGLAGYDSPPYLRAIKNSLVPALARYGLKFEDQVLIKPTSSFNDAVAGQQPATNGVVRFQAKGITHVIFFEDSGGMTFNFTAAASNQKYYPRYGLSGNSQHACVPCLSDDAEKDRIWDNAVHVGWSPLYDLNTNVDIPKNAAWQLCEKLITDAGGDALAFGVGQYYRWCDAYFMFAMAGKAAGTLNLDAIIRGYPSASGYVAAVLAGPADYSAGRRDGVGTARYAGYGKGCHCWSYQSDPFPIQNILG